MSVRKLPSGRWRADYLDLAGHRQRRDFERKADAANHELAERVKAKDERDRLRGRRPAVDPKITLHDYVEEYYFKHKTTDPATTARQRVEFKRRLKDEYGTRPVRSINRVEVRHYLLGLLKQGDLAEGSVRQTFATLAAILSAAVEDGLFTDNPLRGLWRKVRSTTSKGDTTEAGEQKTKAFTTEQARSFLDAVERHEPTYAPLFTTMLTTGLRISEAIGLSTDRLDLAKRTARIDRQIGQAGGVKATKTKRVRRVPLPEALVPLLIEASAARAAAPDLGPWFLCPHRLPDIPSAQDAQRVYRNALRAFRRAVEKAGMRREDWSPHCLRHSYSANLVSRGVSLAFVQKALGHASISMTVDTYGSWLPVTDAGGVDELAAAFGCHKTVTTEPQETKTPA
jgi:integrase